MQQELFEDVMMAYSDGTKSNSDVYKVVSNKQNVNIDDHVEAVGKQKKPVNLFMRKIRWIQQSMKREGLIERLDYGQWRLSNEGKFRLTQINTNKHMVAASTELGVMIWARSEHVFNDVIDCNIDLCFTSPPYLGIARSYGSHKNEQQYIDFILRILTPIRKRMIKGANLCLNLTNDAFIKGAYGKKSLYLEKLIIAISEELDMSLMDRVVWHANNKAPGPTQFTSIRRTSLLSKSEPLLVFCTSPQHSLADNRRVLTPYSQNMKKLIEQGGEKQKRSTPDSKHGVCIGNFANDNGGALLGNVLSIGTTCTEKNALLKEARRLRLAPNNATFPLALAKTIVQWLCPKGGLVVDPFGGYFTTGSACEQTGRQWISCEMHWDYIRVSLARFTQRPGYCINPKFNDLDCPSVRLQYAGC